MNHIPAPIPESNSVATDDYTSIVYKPIAFTPHEGYGNSEGNSNLFHIFQDMVSGTSYEFSIKSYQLTCDGRAAYLALCQHNIGSSRWDKILEYAKSYVMKREWNGHNHSFNLWSHICKHLGTNNEMMRAYQHVQYELLNEHTRVGRLIKSILSNDPSFVYDITHIQ